MTDIKTEKQKRISLASDQQRQASDPNLSVWVEASAGTGKTKVLSDRVLRLLLNGTKPSRILCLTYTKAAAVEMNNRIANRLSKWAISHDAELISDLQKLLGQSKIDQKTLSQSRRLFAILLDTPGGMKIQTIHSFCQEILKRFPLEAKISPYFEVMDDRTAKEALENIKSDLLQKIETDPNCQTAKSLAFITTKISEFTFPKLMNSLTQNRNKIIRVLNQYPSVQDLIYKLADKLQIPCNCKTEDIVNKFWNNTPKTKILEFANALKQGSKSDLEKAQIVSSALKNNDYNLYRKVFLTDKNEPRKTVATQKVISLFPLASTLAQQEVERILFTDNLICSIQLLESTTAVLHVAQDLLDNYNKFKQIHSKVDYEDLIVQTRNLLEDPGIAQWVLYKLDGGIDHVLIDEAQDTAPDQWAIIKAITSEFFYGSGAKNNSNTVFVVGDRKQSIYSFQGADPQEFEKSRLYFAKKSTKEAPFKQINLDVSFRSSSAILDTVNQVFSTLEASKGVVSEEHQVCHIPSRIGEAGKIEIWPLIEAQKDDAPSIWLPPVEKITAESTSARLAKMIAENIHKMVSSQEFLVSQNRPLKYQDFMILVQRRNSFVEELVRECKQIGVNIAGADKIKLLEQIAIQDLVSLGKFVLLPEDDLSLAEVLKSPLFNLADTDLQILCCNRGSQSLWQSMKKNSAYNGINQILQNLLNLSNLRPFEFYAYILSSLAGRKKFISRLGHEVEDGIDEFINLTISFERDHIPSLQIFIDWIERDDVEIKRELEQNQTDAVRIMTVHGSKGLQAPVVILPDTARVKSIRNEAELLIDENMLFYPFNSNEYENNCKKIKSKQKELSLEEYHRLLYVALTRAEERLYICGYQKGGLNSDSWYELCKSSLSNICEKHQDKLIYETPQEAPLPPKETHQSIAQNNIDFSWINHPLPQETPLSKPLAASKIDDDNEQISSPLDTNHPEYFRRGIIIHKLLQILPETNASKHLELAKKFVSYHGSMLSEAAQNQIVFEVTSLLSDSRFSIFFGPNSRPEVPIMGEVEGQIISGQIDRLVVTPQEVKILDYKTNRPAASSPKDVPVAYIKQLRAYKSLIQKIYPQKIISTYILWTNTASIMEIK
ncbi:MAG: double-strand break repair helicase AddA [Alphaproteobacteria bacterium]|nr:double-strand break repair helicase AddA [Alphaproteobacteria bacterium]